MIQPILLSPLFLFASIFILGASIGSFLNVCIYRIPNNKSIVFPGSSCPFCKTKIPVHLNIPILSYLFLKGKCKFCSSKISLRYPVVEALTGFFAMAVVLKFSLSAQALFWFIFIAVLITISFVDMDHQIIPDIISLPGIVIFASSSFFIPEITFTDTCTGILAGGGTLYTVALLYYLIRKEEGMGGGDIKLLAMIGAATGWKGVLFTIFAGSLLGTIAGIMIMILTKIADSKLRIPFGPYLSAGAVIYIFFGKELTQWYFGIIL